MNKSAFINKYDSVRFRRWSRKNFAVFSGLHREISIGHIAFDISEKALLKSNKKTIASFADSETNNPEEDVEVVENILLAELSELLIIADSTTGHFPGRSQKYNSTLKQLTISVNRNIQLFDF